ncbi:hypothetical protein [Candidatus Neptunichlamydia sp. REUL1]|uniref:hypothetical protein n=1 Tax=Candidatus Neptunichlamydia sp. REUL1 TaxID=3064277 RepID=UPI00292E9DE9|nr:hypothetical protein [Candidatus Neptunochlamydia sp. REUL1]
MASRPNVAEQLKEHNFTKLFQEASHPREKLRFLAFVHLKDGKEVFQAKGIDGLREQGSKMSHCISVNPFNLPAIRPPYSERKVTAYKHQLFISISQIDSTKYY